MVLSEWFSFITLSVWTHSVTVSLPNMITLFRLLGSLNPVKTSSSVPPAPFASSRTEAHLLPYWFYRLKRKITVRLEYDFGCWRCPYNEYSVFARLYVHDVWYSQDVGPFKEQFACKLAKCQWRLDFPFLSFSYWWVFIPDKD